jgi:hypothetical protein
MYHPRNGLSVISSIALMHDTLVINADFVALIESSNNPINNYRQVIKNTIQPSCKFLIISGPYNQEIKNCVLDILTSDDSIYIPFFVYDTYEEGIDIFLRGDLPLEFEYHCIFLSLAESDAAIKSACMLFNAVNTI